MSKVYCKQIIVFRIQLTFCLYISKYVNQPIPKLLAKILLKEMKPTSMLILTVQHYIMILPLLGNACAMTWKLKSKLKPALNQLMQN